MQRFAAATHECHQHVVLITGYGRVAERCVDAGAEGDRALLGVEELFDCRPWGRRPALSAGTGSSDPTPNDPHAGAVPGIYLRLHTGAATPTRRSGHSKILRCHPAHRAS